MSKIKKPPVAVTPLRSLYRELEAVRVDLEDHRAKHQQVFERDAQLREQVEVTETKIKQLLHAQFKGKTSGAQIEYSGPLFRVVVTPKSDRIVDVKSLLEERPDLTKVDNLLEIRLKKLDELVGNDEDLAKLVERMTRKEPGTPTVQFKPPGDDMEEAK